MTDHRMTTLGALIEQARTQLGISGREAARRAGISETRWRQVEGGARPTARTAVAMALAVGEDPAGVVKAAGLDVSATTLGNLVRDVQAPKLTADCHDRAAVERVRRLCHAAQSDGRDLLRLAPSQVLAALDG